MEDTGLEVASADGKLHTRVFNVTLRLDVVKRNDSLANHVLVLYTDAHSHPLLLCTVRDACNAQTVKLAVPDDATCLLVRWYADAEAQFLVAVGCAALGSNVELRDIAKVREATLSVEGAPVRKYKPSAPTSSSQIQEACDAYKDIKHCAEEEFTSVYVQLDKVREMPILWYPIVASQTKASPEAATALFEHLLQLALLWRVDDGDVLGEMLSLPSLGWTYRDDKTRSGTFADLWTTIYTTPDPHKAAFDCEDGSIAALQLLLVLQNVELLPSASHKLKRIQALARRYRGWLTIGELYTDSGYEQHCFLVLLDRSWTGKIHDRLLPSISVESVVWGSGVWHQIPVKEHESNPDDSTDRVRYSMQSIRANNLYRNVTALVSAEPGGRATHLLLYKEAGVLNRLMGHTCVLGVPIAELMCGEVRRKQVIDIAACDMEKQLAKQLALYPSSTFPSPGATHIGKAGTRLKITNKQGPRTIEVLKGMFLEY